MGGWLSSRSPGASNGGAFNGPLLVPLSGDPLLAPIAPPTILSARAATPRRQSCTDRQLSEPDQRRTDRGDEGNRGWWVCDAGDAEGQCGERQVERRPRSGAVPRRRRASAGGQSASSEGVTERAARAPSAYRRSSAAAGLSFGLGRGSCGYKRAPGHPWVVTPRSGKLVEFAILAWKTPSSRAGPAQ